jgi:site-specific DNA-cytosine methylase
MRILIACEFSGRVRNAFLSLGHDAWSCDILKAVGPNHIQSDVRDLLDKNWDMMIAFPPCTHLAVSGSRWFKGKEKQQAEALLFIRELLNAPIPKICLENPVGVISTRIRKPDQLIEPWMFGHKEAKKTCLWLKGLAPLVPTHSVEYRHSGKHYESEHPQRGLKRSITYQGIANAMAQQWGV